MPMIMALMRIVRVDLESARPAQSAAHRKKSSSGRTARCAAAMSKYMFRTSGFNCLRNLLFCEESVGSQFSHSHRQRQIAYSMGRLLKVLL